jgi:Ca2+:H+ antiporter
VTKILNFFKGMNALLIFIPISTVIAFSFHWPLWIFLTAAIAIIPLAGLMGEATEELAKHLGPQWGGLINATFGNATELIIGLFAIHQGLLQVVRASIVGSVIGNILLVLGASVLAGGIKNGTQTFNRDHARSQGLNLLLAVVSLAVPAIFAANIGTNVKLQAVPLRDLSVGVSLLLLFVYISSLAFSWSRREDHFRSGDNAPEVANWSKRLSFGILGIAAVAISFESNLLVQSVVGATHSLGVNQLFIGIIVVPIIGNASEHSTAVTMAIKNKMDIAMSVAIGSSTQVAMFVAPVLVMASVWLGHSLSYLFSVPELTAAGFAVIIAAFLANDGKSHWLYGAQLLAAYAIIALAFYYLPAP